MKTGILTNKGARQLFGGGSRRETTMVGKEVTYTEDNLCAMIGRVVATNVYFMGVRIGGAMVVSDNVYEAGIIPKDSHG